MFLLSSSSFSWSLEVTVMLSVIRVTCSSVDRSLSPTGHASSVLHAHRRRQRTCHRKRAINKVAMKNITREFPLISKHMAAQKNTGVLLNTHSHRVHLQRIELQLLCTPTHAHAFAAALCTPETQTHTLMHRVMHFCTRTALDNQIQLTLGCVYLLMAFGKKKKKKSVW